MIHRLASSAADGRFALGDVFPPDAGRTLGLLLGFEASGWSMFPALRTGDRIELVPAPHPEPGDIVVFRDRDRFVCHRVSVVAATHVETTSDSGFGPDHHVPFDEIVGRVARVIRKGRVFVPDSSARRPGLVIRIWIRAHRWAEGLRAKRRRTAARSVRLAARVSVARPLLGALARRYVIVSTATASLDRPDELRVARLAGRCVGTFDRASGVSWIHPLCEGLGIEELLISRGAR